MDHHDLGDTGALSRRPVVPLIDLSSGGLECVGCHGFARCLVVGTIVPGNDGE